MSKKSEEEKHEERLERERFTRRMARLQRIEKKIKLRSDAYEGAARALADREGYEAVWAEKIKARLRRLLHIKLDR